jgi:hypothetical protein
MASEKEKELGYTVQELSSIQAIRPRFACPHCQGKNWHNESLLNTTPTRLWRAKTTCLTCQKDARWLLDPDLPIERQTAKMHRPMGF